MTAYLDSTADPTPSGLLAAMARGWQREFSVRGFERGCPLVAAAADVAGPQPELRGTINDAFETWQAPLRAALRDMGLPARRARSLTTLMISALEGAIVLARTRQDAGPLRDVVRELGPLLDAAVDG